MGEVLSIDFDAEVDSVNGIRAYKIQRKKSMIASLSHEEVGEIIEHIRSRAGVPHLVVPVVAIGRALTILAGVREMRAIINNDDRDYIHHNDIAAEAMRIMEADSMKDD